MSREEMHKLLGGYATDTLTDAERKALFQAALEDQELFNALAAEEPLRELMKDEHARHELLAVLGPAKPVPKRWNFAQAWMAVAASVCIAALALGIVWRTQPSSKRVTTLVAQVPAAPPAAAPVIPPPQPLRSEDDRKGAPAAGLVVMREAEKPAALAGGRKSETADVGRADTLEKSRQAVQSQAAPMGKVTLPAEARFIALRYRLFKKDAAGEFREMTSTEVARGDTIAFDVTSPQDGVLTVSVSEGGEAQTVFAGPVSADGRYRVPPGGYLIAGEPGTRTVSFRWGSPPAGVRAVQQSFRDQRAMQVAGAFEQKKDPDEISLTLTVR